MTWLLVAFTADLTVAALVLLLVVTGASVLGLIPGLVAALSATAALTYWFTPPIHSLHIDQPDDVVALVTFVGASLLVATTVVRLDRLRRRAEFGAGEAQLRVGFTTALVSGAAADTVLTELARGMVELFGLARCEISAGESHGDANGTSAPVGDVIVRQSPVVFHLTVARPLLPGEHDTIEALALALGTALDRARLDASAREQQVRADLARSRAAFLGAVTHDLRTPLATLKAATTTLCLPEGVLADDERAEVARAARSEVERLIRSVDKALELTRIRSGALTLDRVEMAPLDLVRLGVDRLGGDVDRARVRAVVDPDAPVVPVDPLLMEHVLVNLIENALAYAPGDGEVLVEADRAPEGLVIAVVDHGPGIAAIDRERVFEEFVRVGQPARSGTGLGLAVARGLVEAHGGTVSCRETDGGGATFVVALPGVSGPTDDPTREVPR